VVSITMRLACGLPVIHSVDVFKLLLNRYVIFFSFVDDMSVCSNDWEQHLYHLRLYLTDVSGLTLSIKKCSYANAKCDL